MAHPILIAIGLLSYSLYLWHWPVLCLSRWTIGTPLWSLPILLTLIIAFSLISYRVVEQPLRKEVWSVANGTTILQGLVAVSVSAGFLVALGGPFKGRLFTGKGSATVETDRLASPLIDAHAGLNSDVQDLLRECNATPFLLESKSYASTRKLDQRFMQDCFERIGLPPGDKRSGRSSLILIGTALPRNSFPLRSWQPASWVMNSTCSMDMVVPIFCVLI